jgi:hypothetical protein
MTQPASLTGLAGGSSAAGLRPRGPRDPPDVPPDCLVFIISPVAKPFARATATAAS